MEYVDREMLGILAEKLKGKPINEWSYKKDEYGPTKEYIYKTSLALDYGKEKKAVDVSVKKRVEKKRLYNKNEYRMSVTERSASPTPSPKPSNGILPAGFSAEPLLYGYGYQNSLDIECSEAKDMFNYVDDLRKSSEEDRKKRKAEDWQNKLKWALKDDGNAA